MTPGAPKLGTRAWPLARLLDALHREGFRLRPDDYVEIDLVVRAFRPATPADLKALIAPLVVASDEEQEQFDALFDELKLAPWKRSDDGPIAQPPKKRWPWMLLAVVVVVAGGWLGYLGLCSWPGPKFDPAIHGPFVVGKATSDSVVQVGDSLRFSVDPTLRNASRDWARWYWEDSVGRRYAHATQPNQLVVPAKAGKLKVRLRTQRRTGLLAPTWQDSLRRVEVPVAPACANLPSISLTLDSIPLPNGGLCVTFTGGPAGVLQQMPLTQWKLDGNVVATNQQVWKHDFPAGRSGASYEVALVAYPDARQRACYGQARETIRVAAQSKPPFQAQVRSAGEPIQLVKHVPPAYVWAAAGLGAAMTLLFIVYTWLTAQARPNKLAEPGDNPLARFDSDAPPFDIPLQNRELELITRDQSFHRTVRLLRQPAEAENQRLNIRRTLRATIQAGGFPDLVYEPCRSETEYIFVIDRTQQRSQQVALFEYLFRAFCQESVCVERFFFHKAFDRFTNERYPQGLSLAQLAERYSASTLLVWSDGAPLLYPVYPVVEPFIRAAIADWQPRGLLTPVPVADWGSREQALQAEFLVLPADITGQLRLLQALNEKDAPSAISPVPAEATESIEDLDLQDAAELEEYLGPELFQWLAATAVYPRLRWELVVEIGRALLPASAVNYTNLLRLARIPWMRAGAFPDRTRLELLKRLSPANETLARQTMLRLLSDVERVFPGDHFYDAEKYVSQTVNQFLLYAHQPEAHPDFAPAQQAFIALHEQGLYADGAGLRYLENPNGAWATLLPPVSDAPRPTGRPPQGVSLESYLRHHAEITLIASPEYQKHVARRRLVVGALWACAGLLLLTALLGLRPEKQLLNAASIPIVVALDSAACVTRLNTEDTRPGAKRWTVSLGNQVLSLKNFGDTVQLPLAAAYSQLGPGGNTVSTTLTVQDSSGQQLQQPLTLSHRQLFVNIGCNLPIPPKRLPAVYIHYAPANESDARRLQAALYAQNYDTVDVELTKNIPDSTQVRYFTASDSAAANDVSRMVQELLQLPNDPMLLLKRYGRSSIEVWLNQKAVIDVETDAGKKAKAAKLIAMLYKKDAAKRKAAAARAAAAKLIAMLSKKDAAKNIVALNNAKNVAPKPANDPNLTAPSPAEQVTQAQQNIQQKKDTARVATPTTAVSTAPALPFNNDVFVRFDGLVSLGSGIGARLLAYDDANRRVGITLVDDNGVTANLSLGEKETRQFTLSGDRHVSIRLLSLPPDMPSSITKGAHCEVQIGKGAASKATGAPYKSILWVDDNPSDNNALMMKFIAERIDVVLASDNRTALTYLRQHVDLVISDVGRGDKEDAQAGLGLLKEVRSMSSPPPFILYTSAKAAPSVQKDALAAGADFVTSSSQQLGERVLKLLKSASAK
jgi:CheY-like chemotaxis protein